MFDDIREGSRRVCRSAPIVSSGVFDPDTILTQCLPDLRCGINDLASSSVASLTNHAGSVSPRNQPVAGMRVKDSNRLPTMFMTTAWAFFGLTRYKE
jgi:hypothetical protein